MIIANLGDSRAVLCTRDDRNQLVPVQLTTDLKPEIAGRLFWPKSPTNLINLMVFFVIQVKLKESGIVKAEFLQWMKNQTCIEYGCLMKIALV